MTWRGVIFFLIVFGVWGGIVPSRAFSVIDSCILFQLPLDGMGYYTVDTQTVNENGRANYGRFALVGGLRYAALDWSFDYVLLGAPRIGVNDMSFKKCESVPRHKPKGGHTYGRAVDLRLISRSGEHGTNTTWLNDYHRDWTIAMINSVIVNIGNYHVAFVCLKDEGFNYKKEKKKKGKEIEIAIPIDIAGVPVKPFCEGDHTNHVHIELKPTVQ